MSNDKIATSIQNIQAFQLFSRIMPSWSNVAEGKTVRIVIETTQDGNAAIGIALPEKYNNADTINELLTRLDDEQYLMQLELLIDEMRNVGVEPDVINPMVSRANELAETLHESDIVSK